MRTERPILFTPENVRKILDGLKTQTRRVIKPIPRLLGVRDGAESWTIPNRCNGTWVCPFGLVGDRLWVRETWYPAFKRTKNTGGCVYKADDNGRDLNPGWSPNGKGGGWKPSIHMPRWASRLTLEITSIRVERVQEISKKDIIAEGLHCDEHPEGECIALKNLWQERWDSINAKRGYGWDKNPWVWAITFKKVPA